MSEAEEYPWSWRGGEMTVGQAAHELERMGFCDCGCPDDALQMIADVLECYSSPALDGELRLGDYKKTSERLPDTGVEYFVLYQLDRVGYTEHGGAVPGWLTPRGVAFRDALRRHDVYAIVGGVLDYATGELLFPLCPDPNGTPGGR